MAKLIIPGFWYKNGSSYLSKIIIYALLPISYAYRFVTHLRQAMTFTRKSPVPVICIGNMTMGGAGKTPVARAILKNVQKHGRFQSPCFLMRGYGGHLEGPVSVERSQHTVWDVGDEALMQTRYAPVIVARDRYEGAVFARNSGYDMVIMDDGFQNPGIKKDLSFIVVDGGFAFGNGHVFPAGPLREPLKRGLKRATAAIVINPKTGSYPDNLGILKQFSASINAHNPKLNLADRTIIAFAGIGRPKKFFDSLENMGYNLYAHYAYPDHHIYTHDELTQITQVAKTNSLSVITTEKDWVRLSAKWQQKISYLSIDIDFDDNFEQYLFQKLDKLP